jgi:N6-L-threonylcarbamoyladenine synthase
VESEKMQSSIEIRRRALSQAVKPSVNDLLSLCDKKTLDLVASFQQKVVEDLVSKTLQAARETAAQTLFVTGGVAANRKLRQEFETLACREGLPVFFPSPRLSTDNAAMIAAAAYPKYLAGIVASPEFSAEASLMLF